MALLATAAAAAGCADPYAAEQRSDERPPRRAPADPPPQAARLPGTPEAAVEGFCVQFVNWSWRTIERQQRRLAALAAGELRRQYLASADSARLDQRLADDRLAMRGTIVSIELAGRRRGVCVARQEQLARGRGELAGGQHAVYLARLARHGEGWALSAWEPQL